MDTEQVTSTAVAGQDEPSADVVKVKVGDTLDDGGVIVGFLGPVVIPDAVVVDAGSPQPSVGRIVHVERRGKCVAAIVTEVVNGTVTVTMFHPTTNPEPAFVGDEWHWPERV